MGMVNTRHAASRSKPYLFILVLSAVLLLGQDLANQVKDERWYRDLTGASAVKDVQVTRARIVLDGTGLVTEGTLIKVQCRKKEGSDAAYTQDVNGVWHPAVFDPSAEFPGTQQSRPANKEAEAFGPWLIKSHIANPQRARFWVSHKDCPKKTIPFLVFDVPWENLGE